MGAAMIPGHRSAKLSRSCQEDRDFLFRGYCGRHGIPVGRTLPWADLPVPARMLDDLLVELGWRIVPRALPDDILGHCDFDRRRVVLNTRIPEISMKGTKVEGVMNFTKAHELGHVRSPDHERQLRAALGDSGTLPLFDGVPVGQAIIVCRRGQGRRPPREHEADFYASRFLVPSEMLPGCAAARRIEAAWRAQREMPSPRLWAEVLAAADHFEVTGSVMRQRLIERGWIVCTRGREIGLSPEIDMF